MKLNDVQELLNKIGVKMEIGDNGQLKLFDNENNVEMSVKLFAQYLTSSRNLSEIGIPYLESLMGYIHDDNVLVGSSQFLGVNFSLTYPIVNGQKTEEKIAIRDIGYFRKDQDLGYNISVSRDGNDMEIVAKNDNVSDENYSEIKINARNNEIVFKKQSKYGALFDGEYDLEDSDLSYDEMVDIINSNELLALVSDYYSNLYPDLAPSLEMLSNMRNSGLKM
ncbi:MAG: hypothetical protein J6B98_07145 [Bacilli bacterium]|nr:hypothetical protein [Bacilli bacterium]